MGYCQDGKYSISVKFNLRVVDYACVAKAMDHVLSRVEGRFVSEMTSCSKSFPSECQGCPEYNEWYPTLDIALTGYFGLYFGPFYIVKRCNRFNWKTYEAV